MLSTHLAFLIKLDTEADPQAGRLEGRIEHVVSGRTAPLHTCDDALQFIQQVLGDLEGSLDTSPREQANGRAD